jgi:hypothetical protein
LTEVANWEARIRTEMEGKQIFPTSLDSKLKYVYVY